MDRHGCSFPAAGVCLRIAHCWWVVKTVDYTKRYLNIRKWYLTATFHGINNESPRGRNPEKVLLWWIESPCICPLAQIQDWPTYWLDYDDHTLCVCVCHATSVASHIYHRILYWTKAPSQGTLNCWRTLAYLQSIISGEEGNQAPGMDYFHQPLKVLSQLPKSILSGRA